MYKTEDDVFGHVMRAEGLEKEIVLACEDGWQGPLVLIRLQFVLMTTTKNLEEQLGVAIVSVILHFISSIALS